MTPESRLRTARLLVTVPALVMALGPPIADFNPTHVTNPLWPPHARLHTVWAVYTQSLVALLALGLMWRARRPETGSVRLGAALVGTVLLGFFAAAATLPAYGGGFSDPNGYATRIFGLDANLVTFTAAAVVLAFAASLTRRP